MDGVILKQGVKEILMFLKEKGYKTALATSAKRERAMKQLVMVDIEELFDAIVCGDEVENSKPDPGIFLMAAKKTINKARKLYCCRRFTSRN